MQIDSPRPLVLGSPRSIGFPRDAQHVFACLYYTLTSV